MSDYLSTLAARTLRREPACEPRRAQKFEPRKETPDAPFVEEVHGELPGEETFEGGAAETTASVAPPVSSTPAFNEHHEDVLSEHTAHTTHPRVEGDESGPDSPHRAEAQTGSQEPLSTPAFSPATEPPAPHALRSVKVIAQTQPRTPSSSADVHAVDVATATQTAPTSDSEEASHTLRADVFDESEREQATAVARRASSQPAEIASRADSEPLPVRMSRPVKATSSADVRPLAEVRPVPAQPPASNEGSAQTQMPPTIEVTIGRIEVRAVTPPAPTPTRKRQAPPKMSLDDYLRAQSGGRS